MKLKITILGVITLMSFVLTLQSCVENDETDSIEITVEPQELPATIAGNADFKFPEQQSTILGWLEDRDTVKITKHAWGIWQGLTSKSNQVYNEDTLLVYQTWLGATDIKQACADGDSTAGCTAGKSSLEMLESPRQQHHTFGTNVGENVDLDDNLFVTVSYDPNAACYATKNMIMNQSTIDSKMNNSGGIGRIDPFPNSAVTIKPTYYLGKVSDKYIQIPAWKGPPSNLEQEYDTPQWGSFVYADVTNSQPTGKIAVPTSDSSDTPPTSSIVNIDEFIHYALDEEAAAFMNKQQGAGSVEAGDLAILVAMHVGTKEISNWTWQTFFWTTDPSTPDFPSSTWEAGLKPTNLTGAAGHYAVSTAYAMVWPNQPVEGGTNEGVTPIIGYNPYLEPGLSKFNNYNRLDSTYQYGMQSNCMSCHAQAALNRDSGFFGYTGDQYIDMSDTMFNGWVQLDFAWSIHGSINKDK
ncbi:MAG: hypothetical protein P8P74_09730 [Crocinitomicaceae bacterium]|nr:hypothetical protein [Crocinitomicaceae bacterium]